MNRNNGETVVICNVPPAGEMLTTEVLQYIGRQRERYERELDEAGFALPLPHRWAWAAADRQSDSWFLAVRNPQGRCVGGVALEVKRSRAMPGHLVLRSEQFGGNLSGPIRDAAVAALAALARQSPRILRVSLEVFARTTETRAAL